MIFKSFGLNFKDLLKKPLILIYGENLSLITEIEEKIIEESKENLSLSIKRYQEEYVLGNLEIFNQLISSNSLFKDRGNSLKFNKFLSVTFLFANSI